MHTGFRGKRRRGYTIVEILYVMLIIGLLQMIAMPNLMRAREAARAKGCVANLKSIQSAVEQWAIENRKRDGAVVMLDDLVGPSGYLRNMPRCPGGGFYRDRQRVGRKPVCTIRRNDDSEYYDNHVLP